MAYDIFNKLYIRVVLLQFEVLKLSSQTEWAILWVFKATFPKMYIVSQVI